MLYRIVVERFESSLRSNLSPGLCTWPPAALSYTTTNYGVGTAAPTHPAFLNRFHNFKWQAVWVTRKSDTSAKKEKLLCCKFVVNLFWTQLYLMSFVYSKCVLADICNTITV